MQLPPKMKKIPLCMATLVSNVYLNDFFIMILLGAGAAHSGFYYLALGIYKPDFMVWICK